MLKVRMAAKDATCAPTHLAAIHMTGAALAKCGGSRAEERSFVEYALHGENDIPVARGCDHACGHGGFCDLRTSLGPILLGRSLLRRLGWLGLGWSLVGRLGRPLPLGSPLSAIAPPRFFISVLWRAPQSSSASRRLLEGAAAA
jgi:hypothetical protein